MNTKTLAQTHARRTGEPESHWRNAFEKCAPLHGRARLNGEGIELVASASASSFCYARLVEKLAERPVRHPRDPGPLALLREKAEPFAFSLRDWLEAIVVMLDYLETHSRTASLDRIVGYIECCAEAGTRMQSQPTLRGYTGDMLGEFGFEGSE